MPDCGRCPRPAAPAGQHLGEGGLAGAVPADEADPVTLGDLERRTVQQQPGTSTQLYATGDDHDLVLLHTD